MREKHSERCCHKYDYAMLYGLMEVVEGRYILISAPEVGVFKEYLMVAQNDDKGIEIDLDTCDRLPYKLVYGALMFHGIDGKIVKKEVEELDFTEKFVSLLDD
mgnify:CR=1 FL=1